MEWALGRDKREERTEGANEHHPLDNKHLLLLLLLPAIRQSAGLPSLSVRSQQTETSATGCSSPRQPLQRLRELERW